VTTQLQLINIIIFIIAGSLWGWRLDIRGRIPALRHILHVVQIRTGAYPASFLARIFFFSREVKVAECPNCSLARVIQPHVLYWPGA